VTPMISHAEGAGKNSQRAFLRILIATSAVSFIGFLGLGLFGNLTVPLLLGARAHAIVGLLPIYAWAMTCFTIASCLIAYHQIRKDYIFPVTGFFLAAMEICGILIFHDDVQSITMVMFLLGISYLVVVSLLHIFLGPVNSIASNLKDLFSIFSPLPKASVRTPEKLKILIFNWRDTKHVWAGGAEVYLHQMAKYWVHEGHEVTIFCGNDRKHPGNETLDGIHIIRRGGFYTVYIWAFFYYLLRLRGKFDWVIDSQNGVPFFTPLFIGVPKILLIHHVHQDVFREHLPFPLSHFAMFIESKLMPVVYRNQQVVTVSNSSMQEIIKLIPGIKQNIHVVAPGVDTEKLIPGTKTVQPSFLYLGRLKPYKNVDTVVKAFAYVVKTHPEATLVIAGEGESMGSLKRLTKSLNLENKVKFTGKVSQSEKAKLLARSWVVVHPSSIEGWGITVMEANACMTPVIASNVNGLMDSVRVGKTGVLVPVKDVAAFASAMIRLVEDKTYREKLSKNAYEWSQSFSWDACAEQFLHVLHNPAEQLRDIHTIDQFAVARSQI
jgi:glycosyltransferase involved in cell wall biosynthesis